MAAIPKISYIEAATVNLEGRQVSTNAVATRMEGQSLPLADIVAMQQMLTAVVQAQATLAVADALVALRNQLAGA